jgi:hypothetical protein
LNFEFKGTLDSENIEEVSESALKFSYNSTSSYDINTKAIFLVTCDKKNTTKMEPHNDGFIFLYLLLLLLLLLLLDGLFK